MEYQGYVNKRGRPPEDGKLGSRKRCQFALCTSATWNKLEGDDEVHYICVPQPCLKFRRKIPHEQGVCFECIKATKWLRACQRADGKFERLEHIRRWHHICSLHFVGGKGPTVDFPDPIRATSNKPSDDHPTPKPKRKPPKKRLPLPVPPKKKSKKSIEETQEPPSQIVEAVITPSDVELTVSVQPQMCEDLQQNEHFPPYEEMQPPENVQISTDTCHLKVNVDKCTSTNDEPNLEVPSHLDIAIQMMKTTNLSVACSTEGLSIKMCDGLYVTKEICIESNGNHTVNSYNRRLPQNHLVYSDLESCLEAQVDVEKLSSLFTEWKSCLGIKDSNLISTYRSMTSLKTGVYYDLLNAVISQSCSMLFKGEGDICCHCKSYSRLLRRAFKRKRTALGVKYRKPLQTMTPKEIIEHYKKGQRDNGRLRSIINQLRLKI